MASLISVAQLVSCTEAEGPGKRFALWVQGCPLRCPDCCNPEMLPFTGGRWLSVEALCQQIHQAQKDHGIEGLTLLGGEPTAQARALSKVARFAKGLGLDVLLFSGFTHAELVARKDSDVEALLVQTDLLVDGPFESAQIDSHRRFIGSANQRLVYLSSKAEREDPRWKERNTLELRLESGEGGLSLTVNGFPSEGSMSLWKRTPLL